MRRFLGGTIQSVQQHLTDAGLALAECIDDACPGDLAALVNVSRLLAEAQQDLARLPGGVGPPGVDAGPRLDTGVEPGDRR